MIFLIVDDDLFRQHRVEEVFNLLGVECKRAATLEEAKNIIEESRVNGIVTDMSFPLTDDEKPIGREGDSLLEWLLKKGIEIPILGISTCGFSVDYPHIWGRMPGYAVPGTIKEFKEFVEEKNHNE